MDDENVKDGMSVAKPGPQKPSTWVEERMVLFTPEQWLDFRKRVSEKLDTLDLHKAERESILGRIRDESADLERLMRAIKSGGEMRTITVTEHPRFETNTIDVVDLQTGEVIRTRAMTGEERAAHAQVALPLEVPPQPMS
jgi:hypothetical protein